MDIVSMPVAVSITDNNKSARNDKKTSPEAERNEQKFRAKKNLECATQFVDKLLLK